MVSPSVLKKLVVPMVYVAEWILFFYVFLCIVAFNMVNFTNVIAVDMAWEEPINFTASFVNSLMAVLAIGLICFFYIKFLEGNRAYKRLIQRSGVGRFIRHKYSQLCDLWEHRLWF